MLRFVQRLLLVTGLSLLATFALALIHRSVSSRAALASFDRALAEGSLPMREIPAPQAQVVRSASMVMPVKETPIALSVNEDPIALPAALPSMSDERIDFSQWSAARIRKYEESLLIEKRLPRAVLSIDKLGLRVPVFEGTDELVLNRGVGRIDGTAEPGEAGNIGIAGHRDGFFRGLRNIVVGDVVELATMTEKTTYVVDLIEIVDPENSEVLESRSVPSLTLVTCYPFYFLGSAPKRYIVHAALKQSVAVNPVQRSSRQTVNRSHGEERRQ